MHLHVGAAELAADIAGDKAGQVGEGSPLVAAHPHRALHDFTHGHLQFPLNFSRRLDEAELQYLDLRALAQIAQVLQKAVDTPRDGARHRLLHHQTCLGQFADRARDGDPRHAELAAQFLLARQQPVFAVVALLDPLAQH